MCSLLNWGTREWQTFASGEDERVAVPPNLKEGGEHFLYEAYQGAAFRNPTEIQH